MCSRETAGENRRENPLPCTDEILHHLRSHEKNIVWLVFQEDSSFQSLLGGPKNMTAIAHHLGSRSRAPPPVAHARKCARQPLRRFCCASRVAWLGSETNVMDRRAVGGGAIRDPCILHLHTALSIVVSPYFGGKSNMAQIIAKCIFLSEPWLSLGLSCLLRAGKPLA